MTSKWNWSPRNKYGPGGSEEIADQIVTHDPGYDRLLSVYMAGDPQTAINKLEALRGTGYDSDIDRLQNNLRDEMKGEDFYEEFARQI
jgi:hypothetical protein